jgi:photosystem II stability/assembly factor-like uncharacterized protein
MKKLLNFFIVLGIALLMSLPALAQQTPSELQLKAMKWRNIGPFNGGRITTVVGHPTEQLVFWSGHSSGGLWKTEDAGESWIPVGQGQFHYASVGAMALYEKNPDIMYVGLGEPQLRQSVSWGDGMYKTIDGGKTWQHIGLKEARQISKVIIHPDNPDIVWVASMGHTWGPNPERGVFKTIDGGKTWKKVLYKNEKIGVAKLEMEPGNPNILYASLWEFERKTWGAKTGGGESGLWKSTDGGETWKDISKNKGMPEGQFGKIGIAISAADPQRVYALIDNETKTGLYRSSDRGNSWEFVSSSPVITLRPFYFFHLYPNPVNADDLWAPANKLQHSTDGGKTWVMEPCIKDDYHAMWIDPNNTDRMIIGCDGGATVTLTGGKRWSDYDNQSGAQMYRVNTDDQFPYRVYGNAQDLIAYSVPSASRWGGIANHETGYIATGETGNVIPKPGDPNIVYSLATGAMYGGGGQFTVNNLKTGQDNSRSPWPQILYGTGANEFKYRFNWFAPFFVSPHDPNTIYMGANVVFRTSDEGLTWDVISPDLTNNMTDKMKVAGSPWFPEYFGQEVFSTIERMAESPLEEGVIWTGSDDGLIYLTRDGGKNWENVTPPNLPPLCNVTEVEASPHNAATVYIAMTRYRSSDDYSPYLLKSSDYGKTWKRLDGNFPKDQVTRTIREDIKRKGMLFVGTETGIYASVDDGESWTRINLNMPPLPVHDIKVKDNDLVIATHGMGFWILDEIGPLHDYKREYAQETAHLFKPGDHTRFGYNWWFAYGGGPVSDKLHYYVRNAETGLTFYERGIQEGIRYREFVGCGQGRPLGVIIYYLLSDKAKDVNLDILDAEGNVIRSYTSKDLPVEKYETIEFSEYGQTVSPQDQARTDVSKGLNRFIWDMRYANLPVYEGVTPQTINPIVKPGTYQVRLTVDGESQTQSFELKMNPNENYTQSQADEKYDFWMKIYNKGNDVLKSVSEAKSIQEKVAEVLKSNNSKELKDQGAVIDKLAQDYITRVFSTATTLPQMVSERTKPMTELVLLHNIMESSEGPANKPMYDLYDEISVKIDKSYNEYKTALETEMTKFEKLQKN